jgi:hypothetical protein
VNISKVIDADTNMMETSYRKVDVAELLQKRANAMVYSYPYSERNHHHDRHEHHNRI